MTVEQTAEVLKNGLLNGNTTKGDLLYKVTIRTDPYEAIESGDLPLVMIEPDRTEFENAEQGNVVKQNHYLTVTCIVLAQDEKHKDYKKAVNDLMKNTITKMLNIEHNNIHKWIPEDLSHSEFTISSMKASGIVVGIKVPTYWEDF